MIQYMIRRRLAADERRLGASLDYLRHIASASLPAFLKFGLFTPLASHRKVLAAEPYHVARLVAVQAEDCGTCVQAEVNLARANHVPRPVIQAVLDGTPELLSEELADVFRFSHAVANRTVEEGEWRDRLRGRYGEAGLVELALAIASSRVFPTTKRALGYAVSCERVHLEV